MDEISIRHIIGSQYSRTYDYEGAGRQFFIHFLARREKENSPFPLSRNQTTFLSPQPVSSFLINNNMSQTSSNPSSENLEAHPPIYQELMDDFTSAQQQPVPDPRQSLDVLTPAEIARIRQVLNHTSDLQSIVSHGSTDSDYPEYHQSTHAWAVFADNPNKSAGVWERIIGTLIICFQLFAYRLFAEEAIEDFQSGQVPVTISHKHCWEAGEDLDLEDIENEGGLICNADLTNTMDAFVAFFMLGIFLTGDVLQAVRAIRDTPWGLSKCFALLAGFEVMCAFVSAGIAVSYHLFIGKVTDAVEVGVGLLFIRDLSQRTYAGLRYGKTKQFRNFFITLTVLIGLGLVMDPISAKLFAGYVQ